MTKTLRGDAHCPVDNGYALTETKRRRTRAKRKMSQATALGARMCRGTVYKQEGMMRREKRATRKRQKEKKSMLEQVKGILIWIFEIAVVVLIAFVLVLFF